MTSVPRKPVLRSRRSSEGTNGSRNSDTSNRKTIRVIAPATLGEGYTFDVEIAGQAVSVTVPKGGVRKGEEFEFSLPRHASSDSSIPRRETLRTIDANETEESISSALDEQKKGRPAPASPDLLPKPMTSTDDETQQDSLGAPMGRWRNKLCSCCDVLTQATFWMALCCAPVLVAQLLTRLGLSWKGTKTSLEEAGMSFNRIVLSFIAVLLIGNIPIIGYAATIIFTLLLLAWTGRNLRRTMRQRYRIPASIHERVDDCACMFFCGCCSVIQMARHTHDDKEYPGSCCTTTGLEMDAPALV